MPTHKKSESERFKGPAKYVEYLLARAVVSLLQRLPIGLAYRLGRGIGWLAWKTMKRRRATVRKNLEIVDAWLADGEDSGWRMTNGECKPHEPSVSPCKSKVKMSGHEGSETTHWQKVVQESSELKHPPSTIRHSLSLEGQVREVFQRGGANLFAGFTFNRMPPGQAEKHIHIEGLEQLKLALAEGKGAIILLAHMGPWEALTQLPELARKHGIDAPFGAIYRKFNNAYLDAWFRRQREASGTRLFGSRYKFYAPVDFLRAGGMLGVLADQRASGGEQVDYFGVRTKATPLPGLLQMRSDAALLSLSISTVARCQWKLRLLPVVIEPTGDKTSRRATVAQATATAIENVLSESPLDGFWFHARFKDVK